MVEGSCHTPQQADAGHWAPLGPALAALLISQSHNYRDKLFSEAPQTMESSLFPGRCVGGGAEPSPVLAFSAPLSHWAAEGGGQRTPALWPEDPWLQRRHLCTCLAEVRCAVGVRSVRTGRCRAAPAAGR